ncbi:zinc-responsive transcriptional regulator [Psychromonas sp. CNPT3]|uniref:Zn(2+)-responsive transcriptional regulator n=1 Tax=Psychromonas sp. CNPT3 TaxID=314282 RepID=UPI00006E56B8|nr:Zn(2+)-responsive transcriptional regulator [Psychromonas sp. CNPT3]AGH81334.1 zinc-responsive transcriptional regulator [Psychromonas sp. CNPT3]
MYRIGELAKRYQVKADTLRFYNKNGLLIPSSRSTSGYRLYTEHDAQRLSFILRAKEVGFSLTDIAELLSIELERDNWACMDVKGLVDSKLKDINNKIEELKCFKNSLQQLSNSCCGGPESALHCSILEALESNTKACHKAHSHSRPVLRNNKK